MTRIVTITSGMAGVGKTHLAVNLSLELVRRGRQVGLFHNLGGHSPIDRFIDIEPLAEHCQQYAAEQDSKHIFSRGYLGIDVLSCEIPLEKWPATTADAVMKCVRAMDVEGGYDDFLVDTSGMTAREQVCCCLASPFIVLVITPDPQSQAEAFALLRVLQLNGFAGELRLMVNRVSCAMDASDIHQAFNYETTKHLGIDAGMLEIMLEDDCVPRSERYRQAFSAVFPESEAAAGIVVIADDVDSVPGQSLSYTLFSFWERFLERVGAPIHLPGKALLEAEIVSPEDGDMETGNVVGVIDTRDKKDMAG